MGFFAYCRLHASGVIARHVKDALSLIETGPGKLLMFGVRKNPKIRPQIRKIIALKSVYHWMRWVFILLVL